MGMRYISYPVFYFSPHVVYVNGACRIETIGYVGGGRDVGRNSCRALRTSNMITTTIRALWAAMATYMTATTVTVGFGLPAGSPIDSTAGHNSGGWYISWDGSIDFSPYNWASCG